MSRARAFVTFVIAAGAAGALAWSSYRFLREPESRDASSHGAAALDANSSSADASSNPTTRNDASKDSTPLAPTVTAVGPLLDWPDEATLRRMERSGRALFGGIVRAPDGKPCEGATVWFNGAVVARTDAAGAWRADVSCILPAEGEDAAIPYYTHVLEARKERVGFAVVSIQLPSRRVDLDLSPGLSFSGTVVDFDDGRPIGGAELELRRNPTFEHIAQYTKRSDELGRFVFTDLQEGSVFVRGRAPGYDSNGFVGYDFSKGHDVEVNYRLRKEFTLRGRFVPWPVDGVAVEKASVRATTHSPHDRDNRKLQYSGTIAADGRFEVAAPVCPTCVLDLVVADQPFWSDELDTNEERREFDVGDIALQPAAALIGRIDAPADVRARIAISVEVSTSDGKHLALRGAPAADGGFRFAPLPSGVAMVSFKLGMWVFASATNAEGLDDEESAGNFVKLVAGATRDIGVVATTATICYGTVRDPDGMPVAWADLQENLRPAEHLWIELFSARTDAEGRFAEKRFPSRAEGDAAADAARRARWEVRAEGRASQTFEFEIDPADHWIRHDFVLDAGVALRGTIVDEAGAPCVTETVMVTSGGGSGTHFGTDTTRADGSFEIRGLAAGAYHVIAVGRDGALEFDGIHPENGPVTLRPSDAVKK